MAKVFKATPASVFPDNDTYDLMQPLVDAYWGNEFQEKMFPLPLWQAIQFIEASESEEIALRVIDIDNLSRMTAEWVAFDDAIEGAPEDFRPNYTYFVLGESLLEQMKASLSFPSYRAIIWGRLGKEVAEDGTKYFAFFNAAECTLVKPGGGGDGGITGAKIPPPK